MNIKMKCSRFFQKIPLFLFILILCALLFFPFYWMIVTSMFSLEELFNYPPRIVPRLVNLGVYIRVLRNTDLLRWLLNSFLVSGTTAISTVFIASFGAYSLSRFRYRGRDVLGFLLLVTQMIPPVLIIIPLYLIFISLGLIDSLVGLIVGYFAFTLPICIWMLKGVFDTIPVTVEEAGLIDGCARRQVLFRIVMPLALPGIAATTIFSFLYCWDEFMFARILISSKSNWTTTIGLSSFIGLYVTPWDEIMAAATIFTMPAIILFLVVQKWFISGLTGGAVKY